MNITHNFITKVFLYYEHLSCNIFVNVANDLLPRVIQKWVLEMFFGKHFWIFLCEINQSQSRSEKPKKL